MYMAGSTVAFGAPAAVSSGTCCVALNCVWHTCDVDNWPERAAMRAASMQGRCPTYELAFTRPSVSLYGLPARMKLAEAQLLGESTPRGSCRGGSASRSARWTPASCASETEFDCNGGLPSCNVSACSPSAVNITRVARSKAVAV